MDTKFYKLWESIKYYIFLTRVFYNPKKEEWTKFLFNKNSSDNNTYITPFMYFIISFGILTYSYSYQDYLESKALSLVAHTSFRYISYETILIKATPALLIIMVMSYIFSEVMVRFYKMDNRKTFLNNCYYAFGLQSLGIALCILMSINWDYWIDPIFGSDYKIFILILGIYTAYAIPSLITSFSPNISITQKLSPLKLNVLNLFGFIWFASTSALLLATWQLETSNYPFIGDIGKLITL